MQEPPSWYYKYVEGCQNAYVFVGESRNYCTILPCTQSANISYITTDTKHEKVHVLLVKKDSTSAVGDLLHLNYVYSIDYDLKFNNQGHLTQDNLGDNNRSIDSSSEDHSDKYYSQNNFQ